MPEPLPAPDLVALARLARIELQPDQHDALHRRLDKVLATFAALRQVDTSRTAAAATDALPLRRDEPGDVLSLDELLANATHKAADCFLVPRVVEG